MYVAAKTPRGFVGREGRGARSTLRVRYRIVASPLDDRAPNARLDIVTAPLPEASQTLEKFQQLRERNNFQKQRFAKLKKDHVARVARG